MQKARRSSIQSTKTYKAFQAIQPQDLTQAFQFYKDMPVEYKTLTSKKGRCCDMSQYDTIGKIELIPASVLSTDKTNC